jgi:DNA-binding transcriptional LysR family regulator
VEAPPAHHWPSTEGFDAAIGGGIELAPGVVSRALAPLHQVAVASPAYLKNRTPPADPSGLASFDGIVWRSSRTGRIRERAMRNAAGAEMAVTLKQTIVLDDPEAMCRAALLGLGVTLIAVPHALPHLESGTLVRLVPQWMRTPARSRSTTPAARCCRRRRVSLSIM